MTRHEVTAISHAPALEGLFEQYRACVLIPTYNNARTIGSVVAEVLTYTSHVIVVNDGSTDDTGDVLASFPDIHQAGYGINRGKGYALREGFRKAFAAGYHYAIVMDSDGQHYPHDLGLFLEALGQMPGALIVGTRNMTGPNIPRKSTFGNRFSNFWYWVNTGIRLEDTQSGYRLYPLEPLAGRRYFTRKYEFEIEVLVRAAWSGVPVRSIDVSVYYPPETERISHFRPFRDFFRISVLNTCLVLISLLYIRPRNLLRMMWSREGWKRILRTLFVHPEESNLKKASSVGFGVFMGIVPIWGLQLAVGIPLAILLRLNKVLFLLSANISIFPITPFWLLASLATGKWLLGDTEWVLSWDAVTIERMSREGVAFFLGGSVLAVAAGGLAFLITYILMLVTRKRNSGV